MDLYAELLHEKRISDNLALLAIIWIKRIFYAPLHLVS